MKAATAKERLAALSARAKKAFNAVDGGAHITLYDPSCAGLPGWRVNVYAKVEVFRATLGYEVVGETPEEALDLAERLLDEHVQKFKSEVDQLIRQWAAQET